MLDPSLEMADVQRTFAGVGASDSLEEEQFWQWCMSLFGDFSDDEFEAQIEELMTAQSTACECDDHHQAANSISGPLHI